MKKFILLPASAKDLGNIVTSIVELEIPFVIDCSKSNYETYKEVSDTTAPPVIVTCTEDQLPKLNGSFDITDY